MNGRKRIALLFTLFLAGAAFPPAQQKADAPPPVSANPEACRQYALCQDALGTRNTDRAVECAQKAVALDGTNPKIMLVLGDAYGITAQEANIFRKMSWAKKCREMYLKAAKADPKDLDSRFRLLSYYTQAPGIAGGGSDKAAAMVQEIARIDPLQGHRAQAIFLLDEKKNLEAMAELEKALTIDENHRSTVQWLLTLYAKNNRVAKAYELARKYEQKDPFQGHLARMVILNAQENWTGAATELEAALRLNPGDSETRLTLANLYVKMEKLDQAAAIYQQMLDKDSTAEDAWYGLGRYSAVTGKELARGLTCFDRYLALVEPTRLSWQSAAHWRKGMIYEKMGDKAKARTEYRTALNLNPKNEDAEKSLSDLD